MKLPTPFKPIGAALIAAFFLTACASWFGPSETPGQKGFAKVGEYVYVSIPAAKYMANPGALETTEAAVCNLDASTFAGMMTAASALESGADDASSALLEAASLLASFNLELLGSVQIPDDAAALAAKAAQRSLVLASVVLQSAAEMRIFRTSYLKVKLEAMAAAGRDPTADEWAELRAKAQAQHDAIQSACVPET